MNKLTKYLLSLVCCCFILPSCTEDWGLPAPDSEVPGNNETGGKEEGDTPSEVAFKLTFDTELPIYKEVDWVSKASVAPEAYDLRFVVKAFPKRAGSDHYIAANPLKTWTFLKDDITSPDFELTLDLDIEHDLDLDIEEGAYKVMVWADYVLAGTETDYFYASGDFAEIREVTSYVGNCDMRLCYKGSTEVTVTSEDKAEINDITMSPAVAKFSVYDKDLEGFLVHAAKIREEEARIKGDSDATVSPESIELSDYKVMFYYTGFKPVAYSVHNCRPCDSGTNLRFESAIIPTEGNTALLGFDHCFSDGDDRETIVTLAIGVIDKTTGEEIYRVGGIDVPLQAGKHTILRGRFLSPATVTDTMSYALEIDTAFNMQFNIPII